MPSSGGPHEVFPTQLKLGRMEPAHNKRRFLLMQVQPDLLVA
ncbi:hypothetical protein [uncultured Jannaschia sp.]|nr:hypothetical protein [uncultured Jannaschia sp.]